MRIAIILALIAAPAAADPTGYWLTEKKGLIVNMYECADKLCGRTVWMKRMTHRDGRPRLDTENPDPALRDRHWCGIEVITALEPDGTAKWSGGKVYDPKTGERFDFDLKQSGDTMRARGYLGLPLLGKSETWTRADITDIQFCEPT